MGVPPGDEGGVFADNKKVKSAGIDIVAFDNLGIKQ
jgi:hypothetical protein